MDRFVPPFRFGFSSVSEEEVDEDLAVHRECRECGTNLDASDGECPDCGGTVVEFRF
jgi:rRNA maturation endonuclease Nob1